MGKRVGRNLVQAIFLNLVLAVFAVAAANAIDSYDYPYSDPWVATTSVALIRNPNSPAMREFSIRLKLNGKIAAKPVTYRLYQNPKNAKNDLVILIPGLGTTVDASTPNFMANNMYQDGHQVLIVPNDFTEEFAQGASRSGVVGLPSSDAADMRNLIVHILKTAKKLHGLKYSTVSLVGYSLGALQSAFVSYQDSTAKQINFSKTVLINSPVDLWHGILVLDQIGSLSDQLSVETKLDIDAIAAEIAVKDWEITPTNPAYYLVLNSYLPRPDVDFQYLVGANFADALDKVAPSEVTGFANYIETVVMPTLLTNGGAPQTIQGLVAGESLTVLKDFLVSNPNIFIMHNEDDFLLKPDDLPFIQTTFSDRAHLYPHGGHLGNLWYANNIQDLNSLL